MSLLNSSQNSTGGFSPCTLFPDLFIFKFYHIHTFIQSQYIHPSPFAEASLHFFIALSAQWGKPPCSAEPRIELGPALQQADALPTEPRRTIISRFITPQPVGGFINNILAHYD
jgi:hypothetical protein